MTDRPGRNRTRAWAWGIGPGRIARAACSSCAAIPADSARMCGRGIREPRRRHSEKPVCIHERFERLVAGPYCELFGRQAYPGWTVWGNEVESRGPAPTEEAPPPDEVSAERPSSKKGVRTGADGVNIRL